MNRRTFITSLLATTASIPMAKVIALATPVDHHAEMMALLHRRLAECYALTRQQIVENLYRNVFDQKFDPFFGELE